MNLNHLLAALCVADHGSISRAARATHVSQPALSRTIRELESQLGISLFVRAARGVHPTPAGAAILHHARAIRAELASARRTATAYQATDSPRIRFGLSRVTPDRVLARALGDVLARHPGLRVDVEGGAGPELLERLEAGELDLLFIVLPRTMTVSDRLAAELDADALYLDENAVIARRSSPLLRRRKLAPADLSRERYILWPEGSVGRKETEETFRRNGLPPPTAALVSDSILFHLQMVAESDLLSVLPRAVAQSDIDHRKLGAVRIEWKPDPRLAVLVRRRRAASLEPCESLREAIRLRCREAGLVSPAGSR
ncbi:HTH-type transcriptional regulator GbpR [Myxococcaceae bacterium]|nr:HTH-type transcriptional regulator GbpR [Myxococcaceae bacterium]